MTVLSQVETELLKAHARLARRGRLARGWVAVREHSPVATSGGSPQRGRWLARGVGAGAVAVALIVTIAVVFVALTALGHNHAATHAKQGTAVAPGISQLVATVADPRGGVSWGLRTFQATRGQTCLQVGRAESGMIGVLGQDGSFFDDGRFHPVSPAVDHAEHGDHCGTVDTRGNAFLNVFVREVPASAGFDPAHGGCRVGPTPPPKPACPPKDLRNLAYGLLGPDAVSVTYRSATGHSATERTGGRDGAYLIVLPADARSCVSQPGGGRSCESGSGETTTAALSSGVITAVTYRDGHVCRLPTPTATGVAAASCPRVGYAPQPFHPPHVTEAQVAAPMTIRKITAKRYCYKPLTFGSFEIACDHGVPHGYKPASPAESPSIALVNISFTARLAADNHHSVYEFSYARASGPANCTLNTGGTSATTMLPIRAGQRVTIQDTQEVCPGTYTGLVTYQPNGGPGRDTLDSSRPIRDHSIIVGRFRYVLRKKPHNPA